MADVKDISPSPADGSAPLRSQLAMLSGDLPQPIVEGSRTSATIPLFNPAAPFPKASSDGLNFLESIDENDLRHFLFEDVLPIVTSDTGKVVGEYRVHVYHEVGIGNPVITVKASSVGSFDSVPCGTSITARLTPQLETLEQTVHEYVKLDGFLLDRVTEIIKERDSYAVKSVLTKGEEQEKTEYSVGIVNMRGFISEGANLLLQKLLSKKGVPDSCQLLALDYDISICPAFYKSLGSKLVKSGEVELKVGGIEKLVKTGDDQPIIWHSFYKEDGHLVSRHQLGSPVMVKRLSPNLLSPTDEESSEFQFSMETERLSDEDSLQLSDSTSLDPMSEQPNHEDSLQLSDCTSLDPMSEQPNHEENLQLLPSTSHDHQEEGLLHCAVVGCTALFTNETSRTEHVNNGCTSPHHPLINFSDMRVSSPVGYACIGCNPPFYAEAYSSAALHMCTTGPMPPVPIGGFGCPRCFIILPAKHLAMAHINGSACSRHLSLPEYIESEKNRLIQPLLVPVEIMKVLVSTHKRVPWNTTCLACKYSLGPYKKDLKTLCNPVYLNTCNFEEHLKQGHVIKVDALQDVTGGFYMLAMFTHTCVNCHQLLDKFAARNHQCSECPSSVILLNKINFQKLLLKWALTCTTTVENVLSVTCVTKRKRNTSSIESGPCKKQKLSSASPGILKSNTKKLQTESKRYHQKTTSRISGSATSFQKSVLECSSGEPKDLHTMKHIIFVDLDNCVNFFNMLPCSLPEKTLYWLFVGGQTEWNEPDDPVYKLAKSRSEIHIHPRCGTTKDASDFAICNSVGGSDKSPSLPKAIPFTIVSDDRGFEQIEREYEDKERKVVVIKPQMLEKYELFVMLRSVAEY